MSEIEINCPRCGKPVDAGDINVTALIAKCVPCGSTFRFGDPPPAMAAAPPPERPLPPLPERITVVGTVDDSPAPLDYRSYATREVTPLVLRYRWFTAQALFLLFFAIAWNGFLVFWYSAASQGGPWILYVFPIGHVAVGIGVAKGALSGLLNTTTFAVDRETLRATTGPIRWPWSRPASVPIAALRQLSVLEKRGSKGGSTFGVIAHLADGTTRSLVDGLPDGHHAAYIERAIERHIGLVDEPWLNTTV